MYELAHIKNIVSTFAGENEGYPWDAQIFTRPEDPEGEWCRTKENTSKIAYKLNQYLATNFCFSNKSTQEEFVSQTDKEIKDIGHYNRLICEKGLEQRTGGQCWFGYLPRAKDETLMRSAIALECDPIAKNHFLLYRTVDDKKDSTLNAKTGTCHSLSLGTSLFAGFFYESGYQGANVFSLQRFRRYIYVTPIPYRNFKNSPFAIPSSNVMRQFYGSGENWHARTKAWEGCSSTDLGGVLQNYARDDVYQTVKSPLSQEEIVSGFQEYMKTAIFLKENGKYVDRTAALPQEDGRTAG